jgi:predicted enzyme related to lactoylglutathione lyase
LDHLDVTNTRCDEQESMMPGTSLKTIIHPVRDLEKAKAVYGALLGAEPVMDEPYYVQFKADGQDVGLDPHGHQKGMTAPVAYWHVDDIEARMKTLLDAGAEMHEEIRDVGTGRLVGSVKDADGNVIGLLQPEPAG